MFCPSTSSLCLVSRPLISAAATTATRAAGMSRVCSRSPATWACLRDVQRRPSRFSASLSINTAAVVAQRLQTDPLFLHQLSAQLPAHVRGTFASLLTTSSPTTSTPKSSPPKTPATTKHRSSVLPLAYLLIRTMIPYVGFGLTSNAALVLAGDCIDSTVCMMFGFSTLAAAGMGNAISDTVGMLSTEPINRLSEQLGIPQPVISEDQEDAAARVRSVAKVVGIVVGCLLGLLPLLFLEERQPRMVDMLSLCLSPEQIAAVGKAMVKCEYKKGDKIIERGSEGQWLHIIIEGQVEVVGRKSDGSPKHICTFEEGGIIGEVELIYEQPCIADVIAVSDIVQTRKIHKSDFQKHMGPAYAVFTQRIATDPDFASSRSQTTSTTQKRE